MNKLKPCPFCGGEIYMRIGIKKLRFFCCPKCGCITSFNTDYYNKNPKLAENAWNKRICMIGEKDDTN